MREVLSLKRDEVKLVNELETLGVPVIKDKRYWFIRTNAGEYFDDFYFEQYIGLGWDKVSNVENLKECDTDRIEGMIRENYPKEKKPGYISKQIKRFVNEMNIGDIVLIPSRDSKKIAFGEITSDVYRDFSFPDNLLEVLLGEEEEKEVLTKRRKVKWKKVIKRTELDPYLYKIIYSHSAIVDAKPYELFINRVLYPMYIKDGKGYINFRVNKTTDVGMELVDFIYSNIELVEDVFRENNIPFKRNEIQTKINVQCPGDIQFVSETIGAIFVIGCIGTIVLGGNIKFVGFNLQTKGLSEEIRNWVRLISDLKNSKKANELRTSSDELQVSNTNTLADNTELVQEETIEGLDDCALGCEDDNE